MPNRRTKMTTGVAEPKVDPIDQAIDDLAAQKTAGQNRRAAELQEEAKQDQAKITARPGQAPPDIWRIEDMGERKPLTGDLYEDGRFLFKFTPTMGTTYFRDRLQRGIDYDAGKRGITFDDVQRGYCELLASSISEWPFRETVQDEEGNDLYDMVEQEVDGTKIYVRELRTVPLPITYKNVSRLDWPVIMQFLDAMMRAYTGEAKGQHS